MMSDATETQWWLAEMSHGLPRLCDGPHNDRTGADRAFYLFGALGLGKGSSYAVAEVRLSEPMPNAEGVDHEAVAILNTTRRP